MKTLLYCLKSLPCCCHKTDSFGSASGSICLYLLPLQSFAEAKNKSKKPSSQKIQKTFWPSACDCAAITLLPQRNKSKCGSSTACISFHGGNFHLLCARFMSRVQGGLTGKTITTWFIVGISMSDPYCFGSNPVGQFSIFCMPAFSAELLRPHRKTWESIVAKQFCLN